MKPEECKDCEMAEEYLQTGYPEYCDKHNPLLTDLEKGYQRGLKELSEGPQPSYLVVSKKDKDLLTNLSNPSNTTEEV